MIRVIVFLALVAILALGVTWVVDRPGDVAINWLGYRIETSITVALAAVAGLLALTLIAWSLLRLLLRTPAHLRLRSRERRRTRAHRALSQGLIAIASGDMRTAMRHAGEARRLAHDQPLTLLLQAQAAQLSGDRAAAESAFRTMASRRDTRLLGLRGLFVEAQRRNDAESARRYADMAVQSAPALPWAGQAALEFRCTSGDWADALAALERNMRHQLIPRDVYRRQRAVLLVAQALDAEDSDLASARTAALEAVKLAPDLVPAAVLSAKLGAEAGEWRRAAKVLEAAWRRSPHPEIADLYAHLRFGDAARDRLARVQHLARLHPGHVESAIAIARAAIDAQEFAVARRALASFIEQPTQRIALLMADLEQSENNDAGRARGWMARALRAARDPVWTADGFVSDRWLPVSPVTGRIDAFEWKTPVAEIAPGGALVEHDEWASRELDRLTAGPAFQLPHEGAEIEASSIAESVAASAAASQNVEATPAPAPETAREVEPVSTASAPPPIENTPSRSPPAQQPQGAPQPLAEPAMSPSRANSPSGARRFFSSTPRAQPVIPLVHAPDDPGPDAEPEVGRDVEIVPQKSSGLH
ncbi:MAG: HemY protein [Variibacter sp.]|nr:HemY protein [Variibacter sp.]